MLFMNSSTMFPPLSRHPSAALSTSIQTAKLAACLLLAVAAAGSARAALIKFDELPTQTLNGISLQGVAFKFELSGAVSTDATFNSIALGANTTLNLQSPTAEGNASGVLTLDFAQPVSLLSFDVARLTSLTLPGATVSLFDSALAGFATTPVTISNLATFSEGKFSYVGSTPVKRAVVTFNAGAGPRFAMDNLAFTPVPEPGTMLAGVLLTGVCACARQRRRR